MLRLTQYTDEENPVSRLARRSQCSRKDMEESKHSAPGAVKGSTGEGGHLARTRSKNEWGSENQRENLQRSRHCTKWWTVSKEKGGSALRKRREKKWELQTQRETAAQLCSKRKTEKLPRVKGRIIIGASGDSHPVPGSWTLACRALAWLDLDFQCYCRACTHSEIMKDTPGQLGSYCHSLDTEGEARGQPAGASLPTRKEASTSIPYSFQHDPKAQIVPSS